MERELSNIDTNRWIDEKMASLNPAPEWKPDSGRAFQELMRRKPSSPRWIRMSMAAAILAATCFVLALLPWRALWTPQAEKTASKPAVEGISSAAVPLPLPISPIAAPEGKQVGEKILVHEESPKTQEVTPQASPAPRATPAITPEVQQRLEHYVQAASVTEPALIFQVQPAYTPEAKEAKIQGTIEIVITVRDDGSVQFERIARGLGYGLDERAREAVEQWKFTPGKKDGVAVATMVSILVNFSLK